MRRWIINISRLVLLLILFLDFYNGFLTLHPRIPKFSSWGTLWQGLFLTVLVGWVTLEIINYYFYKKGFKPLPAYFWVLVIIFTGGDSLSNFFLLYELPNFDKFMHFGGGFISGFLILNLLNNINKHHNNALSKLLIYYLTLATVNFGAVIYEIGELIGDKYFDANNIISGFDTSEDLIFNIAGVLLILLLDSLIYIFKKKHF